MPSVSQPSPYAEPNTPIASAKRPRTAVRHTGTPHQHHHAKHGHGAHDAAAAGGAAGSSQGSLLQSPPPACQLEQPSPDGGGGGAEAEHGEGEGSEGSWKGRVVSFFSPVLKFVGGHEQEEGGDVCAGEDLAGGRDENDSNLENRGPAAVANAEGAALQLHKEESEGAASASSAADAMDVEAPAEEGGGEVEEEEEGEEEAGYEGEEEDEEGLEVVEEFNPFLFIKQLPPYEHVAIPGKICLPQRKYLTRSASGAGGAPITLVLDLDETLVHCTVEPVPDPDMVFPVEFNGVQYQVHVRKRPHLEEFLARVSKMFEVVVFTASQQVYADALLNILDPQRKLIKHRLFRDACLPVEGNYIKDLNVLGRDITRTVLIDNSPYAYGYQLDNGIPIESWFEDRDDAELLKLLPFLEELQTAEDVRPLIRNAFQSHVRVQEA